MTGNAPVLLSLFAVGRRPAVMIPVGLWLWSSALSFLLVALLQAPGWLRCRLARHGRANPSQLERRYFLQTATYVAGAAPFVMVAYGFLRGRQDYRIEEVTIPLGGLPPELDGLRLLQLTDVHAGAYLSTEEIRRVVGLANELDPDLAFHTGDFLTSRGDPLAAAIRELAQLRTGYGAFGCLGNHEIYARAEEAARELFARQGVRILRGERTEVAIRGARLNLIGVDYQRQPRGRPLEQWQYSFLTGIENLVQRDIPNILLSHNPNPFLRAAELGIELTLAGHTHGGQVQVEILDTRWSPARFITPFISGLYERQPEGLAPTGRGPRPAEGPALPLSYLPVRHERKGVGAYSVQGLRPAGGSRACPEPVERVAGRVFLYVSRGIGTIAAPVRLGAPPEITLLTLRKDVTTDEHPPRREHR
jgi:hypothetical protein